jgi:uncharacterized membrane protein YcfT
MRMPYTDWLRWLGEHSLVVYLAFTLPMSAVRIIAMKTGIVTGTSELSILVLIVAVTAPVVLYLLVKRFKIGEFLFERPGWAHIPGAGTSASSPLFLPAPRYRAREPGGFRVRSAK